MLLPFTSNVHVVADYQARCSTGSEGSRRKRALVEAATAHLELFSLNQGLLASVDRVNPQLHVHLVRCHGNQRPAFKCERETEANIIYTPDRERY